MGENKELKPELFSDSFSKTTAMNQMDDEIVLSFLDFDGEHTIKTCPGDIYKIVNALMDYAKTLEMVVGEWGLTGFHAATYELHAEQLRKIAHKYANGIGYDYEKAVENCEKQRNKGNKKREDDVGGEALALSYSRAKEKAQREKNRER